MASTHPPKPDTTSQAGQDTSEDSPAELTAVVDDLLNSLSTKFASVSSEIYEKIEAMSKRLDQMEATLQQQQTSGATAAGSMSK